MALIQVLKIALFLSLAQFSLSESAIRTCVFDESGETCEYTTESDENPESEENVTKNKNVHSMAYDIGYGTEYFDAYVVPDVSSFYQSPEGTGKKFTPAFNGFAGKFFNMSPEKMNLVWDSGDGKRTPKNVHQIGVARPFSAVGTATFPTHKFYFTTMNKSEQHKVKHRFDVVEGESIYVYDPFMSGERSTDELSPKEFDLYMTVKQTLRFTQTYREFTGREWLSRFPREPPKHYMWEADYFGQTHEIQTQETQFTTLPPDNLLVKGNDYSFSDEQRQAMEPYRSPGKTLNLTMEVISCAPRAFEIKNFLSPIEVQHILKLATGMTLSLSTVSGGTEAQTSEETRTSTNTWVYRQHTPIVDAIYRRAADLLKIDEALFRHRKPDEFPEYPTKKKPNKRTIAEPLQLVHYKVGQQYTAHHDFGYSPTASSYQGARFATILLYLNEGMEGGETSFPRAMNAHTKDALKVTPEIGKAVLFYSYLPDGNLDDFSQHAAVPVKKGEKWLMNLWVWDPVYEGF